jgi:hypothetical protein
VVQVFTKIYGSITQVSKVKLPTTPNFRVRNECDSLNPVRMQWAVYSHRVY